MEQNARRYVNIVASIEVMAEIPVDAGELSHDTMVKLVKDQLSSKYWFNVTLPRVVNDVVETRP